MLLLFKQIVNKLGKNKQNISSDIIYGAKAQLTGILRGCVFETQHFKQ